MRLTHTILPTLCALLVMSGPLFAQPQPPGPPPLETMLERHDVNNDGTVTLAEFRETMPEPAFDHAEEIFAHLDDNGDGRIEQEELAFLKSRREAKVREHFGKSDLNGDGRISREEFQQMEPPERMQHRIEQHDPASHFDEMDANGDGLLQLTELPDHPPMHGHDMMKPEDREQHFRHADTNGDGGLSREEMQAAHEARRESMRENIFERMDADGDGYISEEEMQNARPMEHGMRHPSGPPPEEMGGASATGSAYSASLELPDDTPAGYALEGNFPNPFNASTTIYYEIPEANHVTLTVYNLNGQEVTKLVDEMQPANHYAVNFGLSDLTSGIYFYQLKAGNFSAVNRMLYVK